MNFLPIAIAAYALNGGSILIDKILLRTSLPSPLTYAFYINVLQLLALLLIPLGFHFQLGPGAYFAVLSGIINVFALYAFFASLKKNEASIVGPIVGMLNPFFSLVIGGIFLSQTLTRSQYAAFFILITGAIVLTMNVWLNKVQLNKRFLWIILAGLLFALSYILLKQAFLGLNFLDGLIVSRASAGLFVLTFLVLPFARKQIFASKKAEQGVSSKATVVLLGAGQTMGALSGFLITYGISLANPALINSLFGIQYLVILIASIFLAKKNPLLLDEKLSKSAITQKIIGTGVITLGLYLLVS